MLTQLQVANKAIILHEQKVLLLRRSESENVYKNLRDTPGGRMNLWEIPQNALLREILEETQLIVNVNEPLAVRTFETNTIQVVGITYLCDYKGWDVVLSDEHSDFGRFTAQEVAALTDIIPILKEEVLKALSQ